VNRYTYEKKLKIALVNYCTNTNKNNNFLSPKKKNKNKNNTKKQKNKPNKENQNKQTNIPPLKKNKIHP
jgi:hypothetical protein